MIPEVMTPDEAGDIIERERQEFFDRNITAHEMCFHWDWLTTLSNVGTPPVEAERDGCELILDERDELVPVLQGNVGTFEIYDDEKGANLVERALDGDDVADSVLCAIAAKFVGTGCLMPDRLRNYTVDKLMRIASAPPRRRRGRYDPHQNHNRDFAIACAVMALTRGGLFPTRNEATERPSACSTVSIALERIGIQLSEGAVNKIWRSFVRRYGADFDQ